MTALRDRTPTPITAAQFDLPHDPDALYIYRGCAIIGRPDGFDVVDASKASPDAEFAELGWGANMYQAMAVANENVEGVMRLKSR